jgi:hypothetical protein
MRSLLISAALLAATPALAAEFDIVPNGYVAQVMREAATRTRGAPVAAADAPASGVTEAATPAAGKSRAQVIAETAEAARLGLLGAGEPPAASAAQLEQIRQAGLRAPAVSTAARR